MSPPPSESGGATKDQVDPRSDDFQICAGPKSVIHNVPSLPICRVGSPAANRVVPCTTTKGLKASPTSVSGEDLIARVTVLLETPFWANTIGTESPGVTPAGICTFTW